MWNIAIIVLHVAYVCAYKSDVSPDEAEDITWPGQGEFLASRLKTMHIKELNDWPRPRDFFNDYVDKSLPVLFRGLGKRSVAHALWDDKYLLEKAQSQKEMVAVSPTKKEDRSKDEREMLFQDFLKIYKKESIYMVSGLPKALKMDVLLPAPLRCDETRKHLEDVVMWFSSGDTKSTLHRDNNNNIHCLFRGTKEWLLFDPKENTEAIPVEKDGSSPIDVDHLDYKKFPQLRKLKNVYKVKMREGDCIFVPYRWFHQVNSKSNKEHQNIAVNVWFHHTQNLQPKHCVLTEYQALIDFFSFRNHLAREKLEADVSLVEHYKTYLNRTKKHRANFVTFLSIYKRDPTITERDITKIEFPPQFDRLMKKLFAALDVTENGFIEHEDFDVVENDKSFHETFLEHIHIRHEKLLIFLDNFLFYYKEKKDEL